MRALAFPLSGFAGLLLSAVAGATGAPAGFRTVSEFHHTAWTSEQGAPADMYAAAQTPDGWLWFGGPPGLFRFDGVQFERVVIEGRQPDQSVAVSHLCAEESGDLWVGYIYGGVSRIGVRSVQHYGLAQGMPDASVTALARDSRKVLWAGTSRGLFYLDGARWQPAVFESGFIDAMISGMFFDQNSGALWVSASDHVYRLRRDAASFERVAFKARGGVGFLNSPDGRLWYSDDVGVYAYPEQTPGNPRSAHASARAPAVTLFDPDGHLWSTGESSTGVRRMPLQNGSGQALFADGAAQRFSSKDGLSSNAVRSLLQDMEGNLWAVTANGVDRFRPTNVRKLAPMGDAALLSQASLSSADAGALWIGAHSGSFNATPDRDGLWFYDGAFKRVMPEIKTVSATTRDAAGALWVGNSEGLWRRETGGPFSRLPDFPAGGRGLQIRGIVVDAAREPWVYVMRGPLYRLREGRWEVNGNLADLPDIRPLAHARDRDGRVLFGYRDGRVALVHADKVTWYGEQQGLSMGMIGALHSDSYTIVAGERAVAILNEGRFNVLSVTGALATLEGVAGIVESSDGDLWLNGARGAVRIAAGDLQEALRSRSYAVATELFDAQDGFPGASPRVWPLPTLTRGVDGRLWFSGTSGIGWLDPQRIRRNEIAPPLHIRSVLSDGMPYPDVDGVQLPQGAQNFQINYTATSYSRPERVRFRYRLDGYDQTWIDAGARRSAFYTNLPPGSYRFHVTAANESGLWNATGATVSIVIPPTFMQTRAFLALCVMAAIVVLWAAYAMRIKQVTTRERGRLQERLSERERIARELHDTLLAGVQALILQVQAAANRIDKNDPSSTALNNALDRADALLLAGRDRVKGLRSAGAAPTGLREQLLEAIEHVSPEERAKLRVIEEGSPRDLHPIVSEEAVSIACEALANALRHAAATTIEIVVAYERRRLRISVRDDGRGMDTQLLRSGREGHFGLIGMRERAKRIRGQLDIWSRPGAGTEVSLTVPAGMAYVRKRWWPAPALVAPASGAVDRASDRPD
jgi:signal transduction histidine kinase/ligand-binding sensor domain-containing protein